MERWAAGIQTGNASISASTRDESVYAYNTSGSYGDTNNGKTWTADANDNEIAATTSNPDYTLFWWDSTPGSGGSGSASGWATVPGGGRLDGGLERFVGSHVRWQRHFHDGVQGLLPNSRPSRPSSIRCLVTGRVPCRCRKGAMVRPVSVL